MRGFLEYTRVVTDPIDVRAPLEAWLLERMPGARRVRVSNPRSPHAGDSSDTRLFEIDVDNACHPPERVAAVLRCAPRGDAPFPDYDLGLQAQVMRAVASAGGVPVPEVLYLEEDPSVLGVPFLIMRAVEGEAPSDRPSYQAEGFYHDRSPEFREHMWRDTVEAAARLHAIDWRELAGGRVPGSRPGEDPARACLDYWSRYLRDFLKETPDEAVPVFDEALDFLERERPANVPLALCWGDAKLGNVMFDLESGDVAAVIDWEMAIVGDPIADLASLHLSDLRAQDFGGACLPGTPCADELVGLYEAASGHPVRHFRYAMVFATFWRGAVSVAVMRQYRRRGAPLPPDSFVDNFPMNHLRELLDLPGPRNSKR